MSSDPAVTTYVVAVETGAEQKAPLKTNVYMQLRGERTSPAIALLVPTNHSTAPFHLPGGTDVFIYEEQRSYGELKSLRLWHDDAAAEVEHREWFAKGVRVMDMAAGVMYGFECGRWLSRFKGDKKTVAEFPVAITNKSQEVLETFSKYSIPVGSKQPFHSGVLPNPQESSSYTSHPQLPTLDHPFAAGPTNIYGDPYAQAKLHKPETTSPALETCTECGKYRAPVTCQCDSEKQETPPHQL